MHFENETGTLRFSPSDLTVFLESEFASWMDRWHCERTSPSRSSMSGSSQKRTAESPFGMECQPDPKSDEQEIFSKEGQKHETAYLEQLQHDGHRVVAFSPKAGSIADTLAAMKAGCDIIYQAALSHNQWEGYPDFLAKKDGESGLGDYYYEVWDTKLARSPKPYFIIQLCAYSEMLEQLQGRRPEQFHVVLGTNERIPFPIERYFYYYQALKSSFLEFQEQFDPAHPPSPGLCKSFGRWSTVAETVLTSTDHLSGVASIMRSQIRKLESAGIRTVEALATSNAQTVKNLAQPTFDRLRLQARVQFNSRDGDRPRYEVFPLDPASPRRGLALLPPASHLDVYFDLEGFPLVAGGLEYLFGAVAVNDGKHEFCDWWAHDRQQECIAFEECVDWLHDRWRSDPHMHIYHYAAYEVTALKRLMGDNGTREDKVDDLLRNEVFVDLYKVIRQGVVIGTPSYSLKDIEKLYLNRRSGEVLSAGESIVAYYEWRMSGESGDWRESPILKRIRDYNEEDCVSTWKLAEWLRHVQADAGITFVPPLSASQLGSDEDGADEA